MEYLTSLVGEALQRPAELQRKDPNPLTYPKSSKIFSHELFRNPTSEYRGCPFWAWNTKLDKDQLLRQIDNFKAMGMGGFHMHVRTGLDTEYMGSEFMDIVRSCVEYAEKQNMLACLYDDDRWPSGAAGGKVIEKYPEHKAKHILFTPHLYGTVDLDGDRTSSSARACRSENGSLLAAYDIELDVNGCLKSSRVLKSGETGSNVWYAYVETNPSSSWFNDQTYIDTLSPAAMARFIEITHQVYKDKVGDKFGTTVPCIFTDEPQFATKIQLSDPRAMNDVFLPWTTDIAKTFRREYSADLVKDLPQIIWNLPNGKPSISRYQYHDHVCERFVSAFMDQLSAWCRKNNIMLDGHMMEEPTLHSQTTAIGEAMRCYRNQEMPGMDLLVDWVEYNTAKQASSVSRQNGTRGTMSEIYGVTHWYFTFEGHKSCGDWQAALGITFRVHHLTWVSMAGEGKRDYPACIGYQSPWYKEYGYIEDHFARVGVAMTRGKPVTRVGVIHPIESYWLAFGPNGSGDELGLRDRAFAELTNWLLHGLIDFDFISESLLPGQASGKSRGKRLQVGKCEYDVIVAPNLRTIRSTTLKILRDFAKTGGKVIMAGSAPDFVDAKVPKTAPVIEQSNYITWSQQSVLAALEEYRELRVLQTDGTPTDRLLYQMRQDGNERFVFICNTDRNLAASTTVEVKGSWQVQLLDTLTGEERFIRSATKEGWTTFPYKLEGCASLLLRLFPSTESAISNEVTHPITYQTNANIELESVELSEPNVLMLDFAEYKLDDESWSQPTEVLRIDNLIRDRLHIPPKGSAWKQPWAVPASERAPRTHVTMRFSFNSTFTITSPTQLALEDAPKITITLNNICLSSTSENGSANWWVDEAINTVPIPAHTIKKGTNVLILSFPFGILTNIERIYLLGTFAISLHPYPHIKPLDLSSITWGDITTQGLPFYVGNIIYHCTFIIPCPSPTTPRKNSTTTLSVPNFSSPVLAIHNTQRKKKLGRIAFQPRTLSLGTPNEGEHKISITSFGNRYNAFGHIHLRDGITNQCWPDIWRTAGDWWTDEYNVKPIGVLRCPSVIVETTEVCGEERKVSSEWVFV